MDVVCRKRQRGECGSQLADHLARCDCAACLQHMLADLRMAINPRDAATALCFVQPVAQVLVAAWCARSPPVLYAAASALVAMTTRDPACKAAVAAHADVQQLCRHMVAGARVDDATGRVVLPLATAARTLFGDACALGSPWSPGTWTQAEPFVAWGLLLGPPRAAADDHAAPLAAVLALMAALAAKCGPALVVTADVAAALPCLLGASSPGVVLGAALLAKQAPPGRFGAEASAPVVAALRAPGRSSVATALLLRWAVAVCGAGAAARDALLAAGVLPVLRAGLQSLDLNVFTQAVELTGAMVARPATPGVLQPAVEEHRLHVVLAQRLLASGHPHGFRALHTLLDYSSAAKAEVADWAIGAEGALLCARVQDPRLRCAVLGLLVNLCDNEPSRWQRLFDTPEMLGELHGIVVAGPADAAAWVGLMVTRATACCMALGPRFASQGMLDSLTRSVHEMDETLLALPCVSEGLRAVHTAVLAAWAIMAVLPERDRMAAAKAAAFHDQVVALVEVHASVTPSSVLSSAVAVLKTAMSADAALRRRLALRTSLSDALFLFSSPCCGADSSLQRNALEALAELNPQWLNPAIQRQAKRDAILRLALVEGKPADDACAVCTEGCSSRLRPCSHVFHADCLLQWWEKSNGFTCPMCRENVQAGLVRRTVYFYTAPAPAPAPLSH